jgi:hypothetical protein
MPLDEFSFCSSDNPPECERSLGGAYSVREGRIKYRSVGKETTISEIFDSAEQKMSLKVYLSVKQR